MSWHRKYTIDFFIRGRSAMIIHMKFTLYSLKTLTVSKLQFQNYSFKTLYSVKTKQFTISLILELAIRQKLAITCTQVLQRVVVENY